MVPKVYHCHIFPPILPILHKGRTMIEWTWWRYRNANNITGVTKLRLFEEPLHAALWAFRKLYICFLFFISIAKCRNIVKCYCRTVLLLQVVPNRIMMSQKKGLKKCTFPGKLIEISRGPHVEDDRRFMTSQKKFVFLKTLHSRV